MNNEIFHWVYISRVSETLSEAQLEQLLTQARHANRRRNVTGLLIHAAPRFMQIVEGAKADVIELSNKISRDARHTDVDTLRHENKVARDFPDWKMGYVRLSEEAVPSGYVPIVNRFFKLHHFIDKETESYYLLERFLLHFKEE